jgi:hypothetical protein
MPFVLLQKNRIGEALYGTPEPTDRLSYWAFA